MSVPARLALFAVLLAAVFGAAALAGGAIDPGGADEDAGHASDPSPAHGASKDDEEHAAKPAGSALPGLAAAQDGLRLELDAPRRASRASRAQVRFRIVDDHGKPVRDFDVAHEKRMHLIVVRRDLRGFQHLHPRLGRDGAWTAGADLSRAGAYRVYADFTIAGEQHTLGTDLHVAGDYRPAALPAPSATSDADGVDVTLRREGSHFAFDVRRDGRLVNDELQPYLGAKGHLVTLRTADLAYLHNHPEDDALAFDVELPSSGTYRTWVQFKLGGKVHTAAFTVEAS